MKVKTCYVEERIILIANAELLIKRNT